MRAYFLTGRGFLIILLTEIRVQGFKGLRIQVKENPVRTSKDLSGRFKRILITNKIIKRQTLEPSNP